MERSPFKILLIADNSDDVELIEVQLNKLDFEFELEIADQPAKFKKYLEENTPGLILSDYDLPGFTGVEALEYVRDFNKDLPFILISGYIGEEKAADAMRKGASGYVLKNNLKKLVSVVEREIKHYSEHLEKGKIVNSTGNDYESLVKTIDGIVWESNAETFEFLYVSPQSVDILGYEPSDWYESKTFWKDHVHPEDRDKAINYCHRKTMAGENHTFEYRMIGDNGRIVWIRDYVTVVFENGHPVKLRGIMVDVTDQKETEQELDQAVQKLKERIKEQKCLYNISNLNEQKLSIPEMLRKAVHYLPLGFQYPDMAGASINFDGKAYQTDNFVKTEHTLSSTSYEVDEYPIRIEVTYLEGKSTKDRRSFFDEERHLLKSVTENLALKINRILIQKELREKQGLLEKVYNLAKIGNWEMDLVKSEFKWSPKTKEIHEVPQDFVPTKEKLDELYKQSEDWPDIERSVQEMVEGGKSLDHEVRIITAKGNEKWVRVIGQPEFKNNECVRAFGSIQDIDKRKKTEEGLQKSEQRFKSLVQDGLDMIAIIDVEGNYKYVAPTKQRAEYMGKKDEGFTGKNAFSMFHEDDHKILKDNLKKLKPFESSDVGPFRYKTDNGEWHWMESTVTNLTKNPEIEGYVTNSRDVTDRIEKERKLQDILENSTNLFYKYDVKDNGSFTFTYVSPQSRQFLGCKPEEAIERWPEFMTVHPLNEEGVQKSIQAIKTGNTQEPYEIQLEKVSGKKIWVEVNEAPIVDHGKTIAMVGSLTDITERKEALDKLISTEQKLREIVEHSTNLFFKHDVNHQLQYISPQSYDFIGLEPEEAMKKWTDLVTDHPANENAFKKTMKAIETGEPQGPYELQLKHFDGGVMWARVHEAPIVENGETIAIVGSLTDITEQKKYEERLEELSLVASKTTDVIIMSDVDVKITWVNKAFEELTGYSLEECIGKYPGEFLHGPETDPKADELIETLLNEEKTVKVTILNYSKDGQKYWVDMTLDPFFDNNGNHIGNIAIQKNVTEKIEREKELQKSVERYDIVTKATSDTIWDADLHKGTVTYNSNIYDVFGYNEGEVEELGEWWLGNIHPEDRDRVDEVYKNAEKEKTDRVQVEYRFQCADGSYKYINDRAYVIIDENCNPVRMIGAMQDITKQKEESLWLKLLESAIANTTEAIAILEGKKSESDNRKIIYVNDAFEEMTSFRKNDALGSSLLKFVGPRTDLKSIARGIQALNNGEPYQMEISYADKNQENRWAQISFAPVKDSDDTFSHWICIGRDTTERRKGEQELRESLQEKEILLMEIHHRVKNNLAVVSSMMQLQAMEEQNESLQKKLYDSVARIRTMVTIHEMLYKSGSFSKIDFSVNLEKLVSMITKTIHNQKKIDIEFNCENVELNVNQAIPSSLIVNEVVTNCIKHGFKKREGGKISIELKEVNKEVFLKVTDDGIGLPENFDKLDGSSLGLQLIDVLSKQMEASYNFSTADNKGTEFSIQFKKTSIKGIGNAYLL